DALRKRTRVPNIHACVFTATVRRLASVGYATSQRQQRLAELIADVALRRQGCACPRDVVAGARSVACGELRMGKRKVRFSEPRTARMAELATQRERALRILARVRGVARRDLRESEGHRRIGFERGEQRARRRSDDLLLGAACKRKRARV